MKLRAKLTNNGLDWLRTLLLKAHKEKTRRINKCLYICSTMERVSEIVRVSTHLIRGLEFERMRLCFMVKLYHPCGPYRSISARMRISMSVV